MDALQIQRGDFSGDNKRARGGNKRKESEFEQCGARGARGRKCNFSCLSSEGLSLCQHHDMPRLTTHYIHGERKIGVNQEGETVI